MRLLIIEHGGLDWDDGNIYKIEARVSREAIHEFFRHEVLVKQDLRCPSSEERFLAIGHAKDTRRCLFVAFTFRAKGSEKLIRPISARYMHKKEKEAYEKEVKKLKENE